MRKPIQDVEDDFEDIENSEENETEEKNEDIEQKEDYLEKINMVAQDIEAIDLDLTSSLEAYRAAKEDAGFQQETERVFDILSSSISTYSSLNSDLFDRNERGGVYEEVKEKPPSYTTLVSRNVPPSSGRFERPERDFNDPNYFRKREEPLPSSLSYEYSADHEEAGISSGKLVGAYQYTAPTKHSYNQTRKYTPGIGHQYYSRKLD